MSSLNLLLANLPLTATNISRAMRSLYGNIGSNLDERNWTQILASADPLTASENALVVMYQDSGYLLRNANNLLGLGYTESQIAYTYQQMSSRFSFVYSASWAVGSSFESAANLPFANLQTQAANDQQTRSTTPGLTLSNDATGLLAQSDLAGRLTFVDGTLIANLTAGVNVLLGELGALRSGNVLAISGGGGRSNTSSQVVTLGTAGNDTYDASGAGATVQYVFTGAGADTITGGAGADILYAGNGNDVLRASQEDVRIDGGNGTDTLELSTSFAVQDTFQLRNLETIVLTVTGLTLNLTGSFSTAELRGFATGASTITGSNAGDTIFGGTGNDVLHGGAIGDDTFTGGAGNDTLTGSTGNDTFNIDAGTDTITDLQDSDVFVVSPGASLLADIAQEYTATAASQNNGGDTNDAVFGVSLNADYADFSLMTVVNPATDGVVINSERIFGGTTITGSAGNDIITGQQVLNFAAETLIGGAGNDTIFGGVGNDAITGGTGADALNGDTGTNTYFFAGGDSVARTAETVAAANLGNADTMTFGGGVDVITGFVSGNARLDVGTANNYTALGLGGDATNLTAGNNYSVRGNFDNGTGVFTFNFAGGADMLVVTNAANADIDAVAQTSIVIMVGITSLAAGDFI